MQIEREEIHWSLFDKMSSFDYFMLAMFFVKYSLQNSGFKILSSLRINLSASEFLNIYISLDFTWRRLQFASVYEKTSWNFTLLLETYKID